MKPLLAFALLLLFSSILRAQDASVTGVVSDALDGQGLEYASVAIYSAADSSLVSGAVTGAGGIFKIDKLHEGTYYLQAHFVGYKTKTISNIELSRGQQLSLAAISLEADPRLLKEIQVTGQKSTVYNQVDKQVYNADQFQTATGGTAIDVLKNLPSVTVNAEGEVSLRGSTGFQVLIDGKPVQTGLETILTQLPADAIKTIEIITSPSAKYDPDGKAGIVNITTKKGLANGLSVGVNTQGGLPSTTDYNNKAKPVRYGTDVTLNYRKNAWDFAASANYLRHDVAGRRVGDVNTTIDNRHTTFPSSGERSFDNFDYSARASVMFSPDDKNSFDAGIFYGKRKQDRLAEILYHNTKTDTATGNIIGKITYFNSNLQRKGGDFYLGSFDYTHTFSDKSTLTASALYEYDNLTGFTRNRNLAYPMITDTLQYTYNTMKRPLNGIRANLDYSTSIGSGKLESGYQYRGQMDNGDFQYLEKDENYGVFYPVPMFTGAIDLNDQIHSLYSQYSDKAGSLEYVGGLRLEYATQRVNILQTSEIFDRDWLDLFPSINLLYNLNKDWQAKVAYTRRVQRTTNLQLNPLPEREHSETLEQGDPRLLPEFVNQTELGLIKNMDIGSFSLTVYHQDIKDAINRVNKVFADTILNRIYTNAGKAQLSGLEWSIDINPLKWWKFYLGGDVYNYHLKGSLFDNSVPVNNSSWQYSVNANTSFLVTPTLDVQWDINYLSARVTAQGKDGRFVIPDLSVKQTFLKGRLYTMLQWQNMDLGIFGSNQQRITTSGVDFYTTTNYILETDIFLINIGFNLNQPGKKSKLPTSEFGEKEF